MSSRGSVIRAVACLLLLAGCREGVGPSLAARDGSNAGASATPLSTGLPAATRAGPGSVPAGSVALFATLSGGTSSQRLRQDGIDVTWDATQYKLLRYVPEAQRLDQLDWASSRSYAKSYLYGITAGDWVYAIRCSTEIGTKHITRFDPRTGARTGAFGTFSTDSRYGGFAIVGERVIYRSKIGQDLAGRRTGGGHVMMLEFGEDRAVKLLDYADPDNVGTYHAVGEGLVTIVTTHEGSRRVYDIYRVDVPTLAVTGLLHTVRATEAIVFHEGETSLWWAQPDPATGETAILRLPLAGPASRFLTISETIPELLSIDEAAGHLLVAYRDSSPESPLYHLVEMAAGTITDLDVDGGFFSMLAHGNGQLAILD